MLFKLTTGFQMDKDRIKGSAEQVKMKDVAGKVTYGFKLETEAKSDQLK
jgi:uncharacterized protein YjbJ (UPF0337 family)